jgi:hypothetical protein
MVKADADPVELHPEGGRGKARPFCQIESANRHIKNVLVWFPKADDF